jgi:hypothetical protein
MIPESKLASVFDAVMNHPVKVSPPTARSIARINAELGIELPPSLIGFAQRSEKFGAWFCSLGEDYDSYFHILGMNRDFHAPDRDGVYASGPMPSYLVMINHGHDDDCDCLDLRVPRSPEGEYSIAYWSPGEDDRTLASSFADYLRVHLDHWVEHTSKDRRALVRAILEAP